MLLNSRCDVERKLVNIPTNVMCTKIIYKCTVGPRKHSCQCPTTVGSKANIPKLEVCIYIFIFKE